MAGHDAHMDLGLTGKACVVTGASRGIGAAVAPAARGGGRARAGVSPRRRGFEADVTEPGAAERIVDECERRFGAIDVLVNNAGHERGQAARRAGGRRLAGPVGAARDGADAPDAGRRAADGRARRRADRERVLVVGQAALAHQRRLLGHQGRAAVALARVRRCPRLGRGAGERRGAGRRWTPPLWLAEGGLADQVAAAKGITREEALEAQAAKIPSGALRHRRRRWRTSWWSCARTSPRT